MNSVKSVEAAIDPNNRLTFLLDWELTMKCNLDCDYCETGLYGGHDNSQKHPPLEDCLRSIDFMLSYVDGIMQNRRTAFRYVVLNVYGGESLNHPHIVDILQAVRDRCRHRKSVWSLVVSVTTNAIVAKSRWQKIANLVDEFTVSWHSNNSAKQKTLFRENVQWLQSHGKSVKCVVLMHPAHFIDAQQQIDWCQQHGVRYLPRQLDHPQDKLEFNYSSQQVVWFEKLYAQTLVPIKDSNDNADLASTGRACCGGRELSVNCNHRRSQKFVNNNFNSWFCSVDSFFLYVKQTTGEVFVNKDCKMNYSGGIGAIGHLSDPDAILQKIGKTPVIQCKKSRCYCGLCAPKAQDLDTYQTIMKKYEISNSNLLS